MHSSVAMLRRKL